MEIEWIEMVFNTSGPVETKAKRDDYSQCGTVCVVDDVSVLGVPQVKGGAASLIVQYSVLIGGVLLTLASMGMF